MISSISGSYTIPSVQAAKESVQKSVETAQAQSNGDTLQLSTSAKARLMKGQGMTIAQIAGNLGISASNAATLLGETQNTQVSLPITQNLSK